MISPGPAFQEFTGSCPKGRIMGYVIVKAADVFLETMVFILKEFVR